MTLELDLLDELKAMKRDPQEYMGLLESSSDDSVFMRMEWQEAWWKHFGEGRRLQAIHVTENGRLVGYGPFMTTGLGKLIRARKLEFVGAGHSDRLGILAEKDRKQVIEAVLDKVMDDPTWDVAQYRDIRQEGPTARCILERFPKAEVATEDCPYIRVRSSFKEYLSTLSQNSRHNIVRSNQKTMIDLGGKFVRISDPALLPDALEEFFRLNEMRWSEKGEDSVLNPQMRGFLREAVPRLAESRISVIHALMVGEKTISMCLGFEYKNRYLYYLSGFDPAYLKQSPGRCLLSKIIEEAHERRLKEVDLLRGDEVYKSYLGAVNRRNITVTIRRPSLKARIISRGTS